MLVWMYHRVLPEKCGSCVDCSVFESQVEHLRVQGYVFLDTGGLMQWFEGKLDRKKKYAMLTFDDGWADNLFWVTPVLERFAVRAVLALNTGLVNGAELGIRTPENYRLENSKKALEDAVYGRSFSSFLTWEELKLMRDSGHWDIQAHGDSHFGCYQDMGKIRGFYPDKQHWTMEYALGEPPFDGAPRAEFVSTLCQPRTVLSDDLKNILRSTAKNSDRRTICRRHPSPVRRLEGDDEFVARLRKDLEECAGKIREKLGAAPCAFFWPWGQSTEQTRKIAAECGFSLQFTTSKGMLTEQDPSLLIPRIAAPENFPEFLLREKLSSNRLLRKIRGVVKAKLGMTAENINVKMTAG